MRIPAAHCGLYGLKASMGRVPLYPGTKDERYPGVSSWESLEHIGPISRTVADSALMLSVIAGPDERDRHSICRRHRFDWTKCEGDLKGLRSPTAPTGAMPRSIHDVRNIVGDAVRVFERDLGCTVEEAHPGWTDPLRRVLGASLPSNPTSRECAPLAEQDEAEDDAAPGRILSTPTGPPKTLTDAMVARKAVNNKMWRFMQKLRPAADA